MTALAGAALAPVPVALLFVIAMSVIDVVTGSLAAATRSDIDSSEIRSGILRKFILWAGCGAMFLVDKALGVGAVQLGDLSVYPSLGHALCGFALYQEATSILENLLKSGALRGKRFERFVGLFRQLRDDEPNSAK
jgi:phage-related holin